MKIVILGGGPGGYTAALEAAKHGAEVLLISDELGGECLHRGCIPTKLFLQKKPRRKEVPQILSEFRTLENQTEAGIRYRLKKSGVLLRTGRAALSQNGEVILDNTVIPYDALILATGSVPKTPALPDSTNYRIWDALSFLESPETLPDEVCILGGGAVGIELAVILHHMGIAVSVAEQQSEILSGADPMLAGRLREQLQEQGIAFYLNQQTPVCPNVICCCGRKPVLPEGTESLLSRQNNKNHQRIFSIGDCSGKGKEATDAMQQAYHTIALLFGLPIPEEAPMAHSIYTSPGMAWVGIQHASDKTVTLSFSELPAAQITGDTTSLLKMAYAPDTMEITAFHILSEQAAQLICTAQMILRQHMTVSDLSYTLFPHPTVSEIFPEAARRAERKSCRL